VYAPLRRGVARRSATDSRSDSDPARRTRRHRLRIAGALCCTALLLVGGWFAFLQLHLVGNAAPDFTLTDQNGKPWSLSQERGYHGVALFFGYTHCPDVCPTTLAHLSEARRLLGADRDNLRIAFVTVDPARDTPAVLKRYVALFDPSIVGLTGAPDRLEPVYAAYRVWHQQLPHGDSAAGYLVSHSSAIYLIDRVGHLRGIADWADTSPQLAQKIKEVIL
jgi:protein SCO1/2